MERPIYFRTKKLAESIMKNSCRPVETYREFQMNLYCTLKGLEDEDGTLNKIEYRKLALEIMKVVANTYCKAPNYKECENWTTKITEEIDKSLKRYGVEYSKDYLDRIKNILEHHIITDSNRKIYIHRFTLGVKPIMETTEINIDDAMQQYIRKKNIKEDQE